MRKSEALTDGVGIYGNRTKITIKKNKVASPFKGVIVDILYGEGISRESDLLEIAVGHDLISKSGSYYTYKGDRIGQGKENARWYLKAHPEIFEEISKKIYAEIIGKVEESAPAEDFDESRTTEALNRADAEFILDD